MEDPYQSEALVAALGTTDFLLVQGPPGTGEPTFIDRLIRETIARTPDARVLLTSQTHVAIDNTLERLARNAPGDDAAAHRARTRPPSLLSANPSWTVTVSTIALICPEL